MASMNEISKGLQVLSKYCDPEVGRLYDILAEDTRQAVNRSFDAVKDELLASGIHVSFDDRAERLVDAIASYVVESGNS